MKHKLLTLASAAALLAACSDTAVSDANDEIKEKATVTFFVYDVLTRMPIEDVANYYRTEDKTKYTDSTGTIVWTGVDIGQSYFDFQHEDYAMKRHDVKVTDIIKKDVARVEDNVEKIEMYELGVTVKGKFYYRDPATKDWKPAANARVYIDYPDSSEIYPNEVYDFTKEDGSYEFKNLAANVGFEVKSERFSVDSTVYEVTKIGATAQRKGVVKEMDPMVAEVASLDPVLLSSNLASVGVKDEIKMNFSEVLQKDSVNTKYIKVLRVGANPAPNAAGKPTNVTEVSVSVSLSDDGKSITIKSASGEWADGKDYLVEFDVWSTLAKGLKDSVEIDGITYEKYRKFTAGSVEVPGQVKNLAIDKFDDEAKTDKIYFKFSGTYTADKVDAGEDDLKYNEVIHIKWDGFEKGVDSYNVYVKGDVDAFADYKFVGNYTDTTAILDLAKLFNDGKYLAFPASKKQPKVVNVIVLPVNSAGEALAKNAKALEIKAFERADDEVYAMQTNGYNKEAKATVTAIYDCGTDGSACGTPVAKETDLTGGNFYSVDMTVGISSTVKAADWTNVLADGRSNVPNGYQLYYNGELIDEAGIADMPFEITHDLQYKGKFDMPYTKAQKYKKSEEKEFDFVIVPYFSQNAVCSKVGFLTQEDCEDNAGVWTFAFKIAQTDIGEKNALNANNNIQSQINDL